MRPVILMTGHTFADLRARRGDFDDWFAAAVGWPKSRFHVVDAIGGAPLPDARGVDGVIVTGSAASVHDREPWSVRAGEWLAEAAAAGVPVLGVCYGHQLFADALGGRSEPNPNGREIGVAEVEVVADDPLFEGLPRVFPVLQTHVDAVTAPPPGARVLAGNENTPIQAMAIGDHVRTVQWHPEFDADVIRHYIGARADQIDAEMGPGAAERLAARVVDVPTGRPLMRNFFRHYLGVEPG